MKLTLIIEPGCLGGAAGVAVSGLGPDGIYIIRVDPTRLPADKFLMPVIEHEIRHALAGGDASIGMHFMAYRKEKEKEKDNGK